MVCVCVCVCVILLVCVCVCVCFYNTWTYNFLRMFVLVEAKAANTVPGCTTPHVLVQTQYRDVLPSMCWLMVDSCLFRFHQGKCIYILVHTIHSLACTYITPRLLGYINLPYLVMCEEE